MARVTVEDCLEQEENRFALVVLAAQRTRTIMKGGPALVNAKNKPPVLSLREIAAGKVRFHRPSVEAVAEYINELGPRKSLSGKSRSAEAARTIRDFGAAGDDGAKGHYEDPAYYAKTYKDRRHDIDYYVRLARQSKGPVLEYGVGNGRIALHVARAGIEVHGVDLSRPMLDDFEARLKLEPKQVRARVSLAEGDMREYRLGKRVPLVYAPFNCFLHLYTRPDVEAFLKRVRAHLAPGGRFVFDFSVPHGEDLSRDPERSYGSPKIRHPTTGGFVKYAERFEYDRLRQLLLIWMEFEPEEGGKPWKVPLTHRQFFPREVEALLHYNGFTDIFFTADFTNQPADQWVDSMVVSCRVAPAARSRRPLVRRIKASPGAKKPVRRG